MARIWMAAAAVLSSVACENSLLHDVPTRLEPTDVGCYPDAVPSNLRCFVRAGTIEVRWADNSTNEHGYVVARRGPTGSGGPIAQLGPNASMYEDSGIEPDHEYHYYVHGYRVEGNEQCDTVDAGPIVVHSQPYPPADLHFSQPTQSDEIVLDWTDTNELETGYVIQRLDDNSGLFVEVGSAGTNATTFAEQGLTPGMTFEYRVYATNKDAASSPAGVVARTPSSPELEWTEPAYLTNTCELVVPGQASFDEAMGAAFDSGTAAISLATTTSGEEGGARGVLTDLTPGTIDVTWSVTDTLGGQSEDLTQQVSLEATSTTRVAVHRPQLTGPGQGGPGQQGLLPGCSTCTGRRGAIATGKEHTCVLLESGRVQCWGNNSDGQVGDGRAPHQTNPVRPCSASEGCSGPLTGVVDISARDMTCIVVETGAVYCWGDNDVYGRLGLGLAYGDYENSPVPTPVCLSGTALDSCEPLAGASVYGDAIAVNLRHACVVLATGNVMCWGQGLYGRLGNGLTDNQFRPALVCETGTWNPATAACDGGAPLADVVAIAAGEEHTCAIVDDGTDRTVKCWGENDYGQLGDGTSGTDRLWPVDVCATGSSCAPADRLTDVDSLTLGLNHSCAVLGTGAVVCWGRNSYYGQLGIGNDDGYYVNPVPVCAGGEWDGNACDDGSGADRRLENATHVAALAESTCARLTSGEIHCWGYNSHGELGDGTIAERVLPGPVCVTGNADDGSCVPLTGTLDLAAGNRSACATLAGGALSCWGENSDGELGIGARSPEEHNPKAVCARGTGESCERFVQADTIAIGVGFMCAAGGTGLGSGTHCWGKNGNGELGQGYTKHVVNPTTVCTSGAASGCVPLDNVVALDAGAYHTCALREDGTVFCWGFNWSEMSNPSGQLGIGLSRGFSANAVPVCAHADWTGIACDQGPLTGVARVEAGAYHTCALLESGIPYCWGTNAHGQLGIGTYGADPVETPGPVCADGTAQPLCTPLENIVQLDSYAHHTCATHSNGEVFCWGENLEGQLGNGTVSDPNPSPVPVCSSGTGQDCPRLANVLSVGTGLTHTCALLASGEATCWGDNTYGQLGDGLGFSREHPVPVCVFGSGSACVRMTSVVSLALGHENSCAVLQDGSVRCWGYGDSGKLGTGSEHSEGNPTPVCAPDADGSCAADPGCVATLGGAVAISAGEFHACSLLEDGTAACWGENATYANRLGNTAVTGNGFTCVAVPVCEQGEGREACASGEVLDDLAVATCDILTVEAP